MVYISCRKNFTSEIAYADKNCIRYIASPEMSNFSQLSAETFREQVRGKNILLLVHGYNVKTKSVVEGYGQVVGNLSHEGMLAPTLGGYDEVIGFLWPGGCTPIGFIWDAFRAGTAGKHLRQALGTLAETAASVDLQVHSLGARVALEALRGGTVRVRNLLMAGPAVDNESIQIGETYETSCRACERVAVFYSNNDKVLRFAYRLGDAPECDRALGACGPEEASKITPNTHLFDCSPFVHSHGGYRKAPEMYNFWRELLGDLSPRQRAA